MYFFKIFLIFVLSAWFFIGETEARRWPEERFDSKVHEEQFDNPKFDSKVYKEQFDNPKFDSKVYEEQFDNPKFDSKVYEEQFDNPKFDSKVYEEQFDNPKFDSKVYKEQFDNPNNQAKRTEADVNVCKENETPGRPVNVSTIVKEIHRNGIFSPQTITQYFCKTAKIPIIKGYFCKTFVRGREFSMFNNKKEVVASVHAEVKVGCFAHKIDYNRL